MQHVVYVGPHEEVEVPEADAVVKHGDPVEVSDELAARLLDQPSNWQPASLHGVRKADLQEMARGLGLDDSGTVADLSARIAEHRDLNTLHESSGTGEPNDAVDGDQLTTEES